jgi:hypothetical protein
MSARLGDALPPIGDQFEYEYDFGSTTTLQLAVVGERTGQVGRPRCGCLRGTPHCGEMEGFLPVVNSPRIGVCGYSGET